MQNLNLIIRKYKTKLRDILQNKWPVFFKRVKVMKVKEKLRNDCKRQKSHKTRSIAWFMTESFSHKENYEMTGEIRMGLWSGWWWCINANSLIRGLGYGYEGECHCLWGIYIKVSWGNWTLGYLFSNGLGKKVSILGLSFFFSKFRVVSNIFKRQWEE